MIKALKQVLIKLHLFYFPLKKKNLISGILNFMTHSGYFCAG